MQKKADYLVDISLRMWPRRASEESMGPDKEQPLAEGEEQVAGRSEGERHHLSDK